MLIVTPKYHLDILDRIYHNGVPKMKDMAEDELRTLVTNIVDIKGSQSQLSAWRYALRQYAGPGIHDFIYHPKPGDPQDPTIEQIVAKAIELRNRKPEFLLGHDS